MITKWEDSSDLKFLIISICFFISKANKRMRFIVNEFVISLEAFLTDHSTFQQWESVQTEKN